MAMLSDSNRPLSAGERMTAHWMVVLLDHDLWRPPLNLGQNGVNIADEVSFRDVERRHRFDDTV